MHVEHLFRLSPIGIAMLLVAGLYQTFRCFRRSSMVSARLASYIVVVSPFEHLLGCWSMVLTFENLMNVQIQCKYVVEAANGPTTPEGDKVCEDRGITVLPDIYTNAGIYFSTLNELRLCASTYVCFDEEVTWVCGDIRSLNQSNWQCIVPCDSV